MSARTMGGYSHDGIGMTADIHEGPVPYVDRPFVYVRVSLRIPWG